jgi:mRNA interferase MazF
MLPFGAIVLARFPFTDLTGDKRRPALVVSRTDPEAADVIVCFITSTPRRGPNAVPLGPGDGTGLKLPSAVRLDKLATLEASVIAGRIGTASDDWLRAQSARFHAVFGFAHLDPPGGTTAPAASGCE